MQAPDLSTFLRRRGISPESLYKSPEAAAELPRVSFLYENWLKSRHELRSYVVYMILVPISAPMFYFLFPSTLMLFCAVGFATTVIATGGIQIIRRKRAMNDYIAGMERLVHSLQGRGSQWSHE